MMHTGGKGRERGLTRGGLPLCERELEREGKRERDSECESVSKRDI